MQGERLLLSMSSTAVSPQRDDDHDRLAASSSLTAITAASADQRVGDEGPDRISAVDSRWPETSSG